MIRMTSIAALFMTAALLPATGASAATNLNARIDHLTQILRSNAQFASRDFSFALNNGNGPEALFKGIEGIRGFSDYTRLNTWMLRNAPASNAFNGGSYKFTHSVLDNYFTPPAPASAGPEPIPAPVAPNAFNGGAYTFTHSVLDSYFTSPEAPEIAPLAEPEIPPQAAFAEARITPRMAPLPPIPEPATWAMMIGGFAMAGIMLRRRKTRLQVA